MQVLTADNMPVVLERERRGPGRRGGPKELAAVVSHIMGGGAG